MEMDRTKIGSAVHTNNIILLENQSSNACVCVFNCVLFLHFFVLGVAHILFGNNENKQIPRTSGTSSSFMDFDKERVEEVAVQNLVKEPKLHQIVHHPLLWILLLVFLPFEQPPRCVYTVKINTFFVSIIKTHS